MPERENRLIIQGVVEGPTIEKVDKNLSDLGIDAKNPTRTRSIISYDDNTGDIVFLTKDETEVGVHIDDYPSTDIKTASEIDQSKTPQTWLNHTKNSRRGEIYINTEKEYQKRGAIPGFKIKKRGGFGFSKTVDKLYIDRES